MTVVILMGLFLMSFDEESGDLVAVAPAYEEVEYANGRVVPLHDVLLTYWDGAAVRERTLHSGVVVTASAGESAGTPDLWTASPYLAPTYLDGAIVKSCLSVGGTCKDHLGVRLNSATARLDGSGWRIGMLDDKARFDLLTRDKSPTSLVSIPMPSVMVAWTSSAFLLTAPGDPQPMAGGIQQLIAHIFRGATGDANTDLAALGAPVDQANLKVIVLRSGVFDHEHASATEDVDWHHLLFDGPLTMMSPVRVPLRKKDWGFLTIPGAPWRCPYALVGPKLPPP